MQPLSPELDERWSQLLDGALDDAGRHELVAMAAAELNRAVADRGGDCRTLLDAIGAVAGQPVTDQLWEDASRGIELALGASVARLVNWLVLDSGFGQRLGAVRPLLEPAAAAFLTDLLVRHGDRLERASYLYVTRCEHDWRLINREITTDRATGRVTVRLRISKYNGDLLVIEGRPDSILTLADAVLTAVNAVGDRGAFLQDIGPFMDTVEQTLTMLTGEPAGPDGSPGAGPPGMSPPGMGPPGMGPPGVGPAAPTPYR